MISIVLWMMISCFPDKSFTLFNVMSDQHDELHHDNLVICLNVFRLIHITIIRSNQKHQTHQHLELHTVLSSFASSSSTSFFFLSSKNIMIVIIVILLHVIYLIFLHRNLRRLLLLVGPAVPARSRIMRVPRVVQQVCGCWNAIY